MRRGEQPGGNPSRLYGSQHSGRLAFGFVNLLLLWRLFVLRQPLFSWAHGEFLASMTADKQQFERRYRHLCSLI